MAEQDETTEEDRRHPSNAEVIEALSGYVKKFGELKEEVSGLKKDVAGVQESVNKNAKNNQKGHDEIKKDLKPIIEERKFRKQLDSQVDKWMPRVPLIIMVIAAVIWYIKIQVLGVPE